MANVNRWVKQGILERIIRGAYLLPGVAFSPQVVACQLVPDSYLSLEWALAHHGVLLDRTYRLDLVCPRRVQSFTIRTTETAVHKLPPRLYWGWALEESRHGPFRVATPEKALLDRIHLDPTALPNPTYFEDMGLDAEGVRPEAFAELTASVPKLRPFCRPLQEYCHG